MALDSTHPRYNEMLPDWEQMRDVFKGQRHVKDKGPKYLPPTKGMRLDGYGQPAPTNGAINYGLEAYNSYLLRAVLPDYVSDAVEAFIGLLCSQPAQFELPPQMEDMRDNASSLGESLELLLRRIYEEQLVTGRLGLLLDLPKVPDPAKPMPYIALYIAEAIRNWDDNEINEDVAEAKLNMVLLDESGWKREGFEWRAVVKYRILQLGDGMQGGVSEAELEDDVPQAPGVHMTGVFEEAAGTIPEYNQELLIAPMIRGVTLDEIPFVFVNSKDIVANPDMPPLLSLCNQCLTIYRGEADYRQNLFMQGQDTLVVKGDLKRTASSDPNELQPSRGNQLNDSEPLRTGAGSMIHLDSGPGVGAEYIGIDSQGLAEQRTALENDRARAEEKSGKLSTSTNNGLESGEALKTRIGSQTASLTQIAKTGAAALEWILKVAAKWMGADPDAVKVTPNLEFTNFQMDGGTLLQIVQAKNQGAPLSWESIHGLAAEGGLTKLDFESEKELLDKETAEAIAKMPMGTDAGGNPVPIDPKTGLPAQLPGQPAPPKPANPPKPAAPAKPTAPAPKKA